MTSGLYVNNGDTSSYPPSDPFFGEVRAADYYVTRSAFNAGLITEWDFTTPIFRAVLSDESVSARDRFAIGNRPIVNVLGETIADNGSDLFSGNIQRSLAISEFGTPVSGTAWTGSGSSGGSTDTCGDWLNPSLQGAVGDVTATDAQWISSNLQTCFSQARFYGIGPFVPEFDVPLVSVSLIDDTDTPGDGVTRNPSVRVDVFESSLISQIDVTYDGLPVPAASGRNLPFPGGQPYSFSIGSNQFENAGASPYANSSHTIVVQVTDEWGNTSTPVSLTYDYLPTTPYQPTFTIREDFDTGVVGDFVTSEDFVFLLANADPNIDFTIKTYVDGALVQEDPFRGSPLNGPPYLNQIQGIFLDLGPNEITLVAESPSGLTSSFTQTITRVAPQLVAAIIDETAAEIAANEPLVPAPNLPSRLLMTSCCCCSEKPPWTKPMPS